MIIIFLNMKDPSSWSNTVHEGLPLTVFTLSFHLRDKTYKCELLSQLFITVNAVFLWYAYCTGYRDDSEFSIDCAALVDMWKIKI